MSNMKTADVVTEFQKIMTAMAKQTGDVLQKLSAEEQPVELMEPVYFNQKFANEVNLPTVYRLNKSSMRYYFTYKPPAQAALPFSTPEDYITFYPSVTTIISNTTPMSFGLRKILGDLGNDGYRQFMKEKASYGTFLHIQIANYLRSGNTPEERHYNVDNIPSLVDIYVEENHIDFDVRRWKYQAGKDLLSLISFIYEHNVEPIAIEVAGCYDDGIHRFAGAIDLICKMEIQEKGFWGETYKSGERKGEPKETSKTIVKTAIIDFKSGKSGFFDDYQIQLEMYKMIVEQQFGLKIDLVGNVAPKDWDTSPTFSFKDQTNSAALKKVPYLLGAFYCDFEAPKNIMMINGTVNGGPESLNKVIRKVSAAEYAYNLLNSRA